MAGGSKTLSLSGLRGHPRGFKAVACRLAAAARGHAGRNRRAVRDVGIRAHDTARVLHGRHDLRDRRSVNAPRHEVHKSDVARKQNTP